MEVKKFIAVSAAVVSIAGVAILAQASTTTVATDSNRSWVYGKTSTTYAESVLTDNVESHWSDVYNYTNGADDTVSEPVHYVSNAHLTVASNADIYYSCSVIGWGPVLN